MLAACRRDIVGRIQSSLINAEGSLPYGLCNWELFRKERFCYVDRTQSLAALDNTTVHSCLWSHRRTGKSLLTDQMTHWHDKAVCAEQVLPISGMVCCEYGLYLEEISFRRHVFRGSSDL